MSAIDPAIVEAALRAVPFAHRDGEGCAHRLYGPCAACEADALAPLIADAVERAKAEGKREALREAAAQWVDGGLITTDKLRRFLLDRATALTEGVES